MFGTILKTKRRESRREMTNEMTNLHICKFELKKTLQLHKTMQDKKMRNFYLLKSVSNFIDFNFETTYSFKKYEN